MKIADMDKKVDIVVKGNNNGPFGIKYNEFITNIWAKQEQLTSSQLVQAIGEGNKVPVNFIIRRNDKVTRKMFVRYNGQLYDIVSAVPLNGNTSYTILTCFELES